MKQNITEATYHFIKLVISQQDVIEKPNIDTIENIFYQSTEEGTELEMAYGLFAFGYLAAKIGRIPEDSLFEGVLNSELLEAVKEMFKEEL